MSLFDLLCELVNSVFLLTDRDDSKGLDRVRYYIKRTFIITGGVMVVIGLFVVINLMVLHW